ncbi:chemotaxis protein CheW [Dongia deserti]|uniref:chemotaxis protein CheW n=1 Tax=Dongia deserti TaxID=2268030 RepID=UPI002546C30A|nr:chemotaxis protein CheW [Dongia deserti]
MRERAQRLATPAQSDEETGPQIEVVEFLLARERYGVESRFVREVYPLESLAPIPCVPDYVVSIANVRGEIISVIDIRKFFDLPERGLTDLNKVIVLQDDRMVFGILADAVTGARRVPVQQLQPSLPTLTGIREAYLRGVDRDRVAILDGARLLHDPALVVQQRTGA